MIATDSGVADFFTLLAVVLLAGCVALLGLVIAGKNPTPEGKQSLYPTYAAALGWAGVMFGWLGTLVT